VLSLQKLEEPIETKKKRGIRTTASSPKIREPVPKKNPSNHIDKEVKKKKKKKKTIEGKKKNP